MVAGVSAYGDRVTCAFSTYVLVASLSVHPTVHVRGDGKRQRQRSVAAAGTAFGQGLPVWWTVPGGLWLSEES